VLVKSGVNEDNARVPQPRLSASRSSGELTEYVCFGFHLACCGTAARSWPSASALIVEMWGSGSHVVVKRFLVSVIGAGALTVGGVIAAAPAGAQPVTQQDLVNVTIQNVGVQIPVSLAANVCNVNVAVLVDKIQDRPADCAADAGSEANLVLADPGGP
jgi:hypothetical protein